MWSADWKIQKEIRGLYKITCIQTFMYMHIWMYISHGHTCTHMHTHEMNEWKHEGKNWTEQI